MKNQVKGEFLVNKQRVYRRLQIKEGTSSYDYSEDVIDGLCQIAEEKIETVNLYCILDNTYKLGIELLDNCEKLVFCFSYTSNDIVDSIDKLMTDGDFLESLILNDIANEVIFNDSQKMNDEIYEITKKQGYNLTDRFSPGENGLAMEYQKDLLDVFKKEFNVDATLTETYMIEPLKSMLSMFGMDKNIPENSIEHDCNKCSNIQCFYRLVD